MDKEFQNITQGRVPAKQTISFMQRTEEKFDNLENMTNQITIEMAIMKKDIQQINEKLDCHTEKFDKLNEKMDKFIVGWNENADKKYASKTVERILLWTGAIIGAGIIGAILKTILK